MAAKTPPTEHLDWASAAVSIVDTGLAKQQTGFLVSEAPGAGELNYIYRTAGKWSELVSKSLAGRMAMNNIDYTGLNPVGFAGHAHIQYIPAADKWYSVSVAQGFGGDVYVRDSDDGETWSSPKLIAFEASATGNDTSKMVYNAQGDYIAIAVDNKAYWSSDNTVANFGSSATFSVIDTVSDFVCLDNGVWVACGADAGTGKGKVERATVISSWSGVEASAVTDANFNAMATDGVTVTICSNNNNDPIWDDSGLANDFSTQSTPAPTSMNHISWAPSLAAFVGLGFGNDRLYTSRDGEYWVDQFTDNGIPALHNIAHTPDFFVAWDLPTTSTNGIDYSTVYIFSNPMTPTDGITYEVYGETWGETLPITEDDLMILHGGQGKLIFLYNNSGDFAVARYGAS